MVVTVATMTKSAVRERSAANDEDMDQTVYVIPLLISIIKKLQACVNKIAELVGRNVVLESKHESPKIVNIGVTVTKERENDCLVWKLQELESEDRTLQFTVTPVHAAIIMKFQEQTSCYRFDRRNSSKDGLFLDKQESSSGGDSNDHLYTLVDIMADGGKTAVNSEEMMADDDDAERSVASVEDQLQKEMIVYEVCSLFSLFYTSPQQ
ncbi:hypothetical protein Tco_1261327 [Tanacetum coccineum]